MVKSILPKIKQDAPSGFPVRIAFKEKAAFDKFKKFETIMTVKGMDVTDVLENFFGQVIVGNEETMGGRRIVDAAELAEIVGRELGVNYEPSRANLFHLRKEWTEGVEYFTAPRGDNVIIRYDADLCLPKIREFFEGKAK